MLQYVSAATCATTRRRRLLSVTGFPVSFRPALAEFTAVGWPRSIGKFRRARSIRPCPRHESAKFGSVNADLNEHVTIPCGFEGNMIPSAVNVAHTVYMRLVRVVVVRLSRNPEAGPWSWSGQDGPVRIQAQPLIDPQFYRGDSGYRSFAAARYNRRWIDTGARRRTPPARTIHRALGGPALGRPEGEAADNLCCA